MVTVWLRLALLWRERALACSHLPVCMRITSEWLFNFFQLDQNVFKPNRLLIFDIINLFLFSLALFVHFYVCQSHQFRFLFATFIEVWPFVFQPFIVRIEPFFSLYWCLSQLWCALHSRYSIYSNSIWSEKMTSNWIEWWKSKLNWKTKKRIETLLRILSTKWSLSRE